MSYVGNTYNPYATLPSQQYATMEKPLATHQQIQEYDRVKRKNNGLIIGLVIIILLLIAAIIAIFVLLYAPGIVIPTTTVSPPTNVLTAKMEIIHKTLTFDNNYASSNENGFKGLVDIICNMVKNILTPAGITASSCSATVMSANDAAASPTGIKVEDFTIKVALGDKTVDEMLILVRDKLTATDGIKDPYTLTTNSLAKVSDTT